MITNKNMITNRKTKNEIEKSPSLPKDSVVKSGIKTAKGAINFVKNIFKQ